MRFADYLSRNSWYAPAPESKDDEKLVVNTIQEIKHLLLKHNIDPIGVLKPTGKCDQSDCSTQNKENDVIDTKQNSHEKQKNHVTPKQHNGTS